MEQLSDNKVKSMVVDSTGIYYINQDDGNKLYWMSLDGKETKKIADDNIQEINLNMNYLFFTLNNETFMYEDMMPIVSGEIYRIDRDGKNKEKLTDDLAFDINITEDSLYYINKSDNMKIYKIDLSNMKSEKLNDDAATDLNISNDKIYYANLSDPITVSSEYVSFTGGRLYSSDLNGENKVKLADSLVSKISVSDEGIYFYEYYDNGNQNYELRRKYDTKLNVLKYMIYLPE